MAVLDIQFPSNRNRTQGSEERPVTQQKEMTVDDVLSSLKGHLPPAINFTSFQSASSAQHSVARLEQPRAQYCVGDTLNVLVEMRDYERRPKAHGGDFILARIHSPDLKASASGHVTDLRNGSYRVRFTLFWPGEVQVSVLLIHPAEVVHFLWRTAKRNYNKINWTAIFAKGNKTEASLCHLKMDKKTPLCEFKDEEEEENFPCARPRTLPCNSLKTLHSYNTNGPHLTKEGAPLLDRKNIAVAIKNHFKALQVISCSGANMRPSGPCVAGMNPPFPSGYFFQNRWTSNYCQTGSFFSANALNSCLAGRKIYFRGDSTVHQYYYYLVDMLKDLKFRTPFGPCLSQLAIDAGRNITVHYMKHYTPWISGHDIPVEGCAYISRDMDTLDLNGSRQNAVVLSFGQHFRAFPLEFFIQRLLNIRRAILRLQARSPQTLVMVKLENTRELSAVIVRTMRLSDWFGYLQNLAQRKVFGDLNVALLDAWDMTVAAKTFAVHPNQIVVSNEVALFLSHLCHHP